MCIRDRQEGVSHEGEKLGLELGGVGHGRSVARAGRGVKRSCLLYTSDAADERSSVDLGGRRIIKKKNKR